MCIIYHVIKTLFFFAPFSLDLSLPFCMFGIGNYYQFHIVVLRRIRSLSLSLSLFMNIVHVTEWFLEPSDVFLQPFVSFYVCLPLSLSLFLSRSSIILALSHCILPLHFLTLSSYHFS